MKICHVGVVLRPGGGPAGYLHNLECILSEFKCSEIGVWVSSRSAERSGVNNRYADLFKIIKNFPASVRKMLFNVGLIKNNAKIYKIAKKYIAENNGAFPIFHDQGFAFAYWKLTGNEYGLMPHQPKELSSEAADIYAERYNLPVDYVYSKLICNELNSYKNAKFLVTPTSYSLDGYFKKNSYYKMVLSKKKLINVLSTVVKPKVTKSRDVIRRELGLRANDIAVGFAGRYTEDKGFDLYCELATKANNYFKFYSAGSGLIKPSAEIHNLGWRSDIADIIYAMDLLVIPNRITYFDLLPIESLLISTPVVVSEIGGNKWLIENISSGVFSFKNSEDFIEKFKNDVGINRVDSDSFNVFSKSRFLDSHRSIINLL